MDKYLEIGRIINKRGIRGELKIEHYANNENDFANFNKVYLSKDGKDSKTVESCKTYKGFVYLKLSGIDTPEDADALRGKFIYVDRDDIVLDDDEVFIADLIGLDVIDAVNGKKYGKIKEVVNYGRYDTYVITDGINEYMMPAVDEFIDRIVLAEAVYITPIEGLFESAEEIKE